MILCIDCGNSRIKWGLHADGRWQEVGAVDRTAAAELADLTRRWPRPQRVMVANVAGAAVGDAVAAALAPWGSIVAWAVSEAARAGVSNGYANPEQLGVDRWCALIGARGLVAGASLVVCAGTATTVDALDADGHFRGGLILPGFDLMRRALAGNTAQLYLAEGHWQEFPRCTEDALISGCLEAQVGAIERAYRRIAGEPGAQCLLTGGAAPAIAAQLDVPHRLVDNLVLEGLRRLAAD